MIPHTRCTGTHSRFWPLSCSSDPPLPHPPYSLAYLTVFIATKRTYTQGIALCVGDSRRLNRSAHCRESWHIYPSPSRVFGFSRRVHLQVWFYIRHTCILSVTPLTPVSVGNFHIFSIYFISVHTCNAKRSHMSMQMAVCNVISFIYANPHRSSHMCSAFTPKYKLLRSIFMYHF
jgi:hypothetical protein